MPELLYCYERDFVDLSSNNIPNHLYANSQHQSLAATAATLYSSVKEVLLWGYSELPTSHLMYLLHVGNEREIGNNCLCSVQLRHLVFRPRYSSFPSCFTTSYQGRHLARGSSHVTLWLLTPSLTCLFILQSRSTTGYFSRFRVEFGKVLLNHSDFVISPSIVFLGSFVWMLSSTGLLRLLCHCNGNNYPL